MSCVAARGGRRPRRANQHNFVGRDRPRPHRPPGRRLAEPRAWEAMEEEEEEEEGGEEAVAALKLGSKAQVAAQGFSLKKGLLGKFGDVTKIERHAGGNPTKDKLTLNVRGGHGVRGSA